MSVSLRRLRQLVSDTLTVPSSIVTADDERPGEPRVTWSERAARFRQEPVTVLLTGPDGCGRSTIARALERTLFDSGRAVALLDDNPAWEPVTPHRGRRCATAFLRAIRSAKLLNDAGLIALCACSAPTIEIRRRAQLALEPRRLLEIYLSAPPVSPRSWSDDAFPTYQAPPCPDLTISAHLWRVSSSVDAILKHLQRHRVLR
jgi:adenylylsulfate kinase-like enzyme